jgi:hypothetical protein
MKGGVGSGSDYQGRVTYNDVNTGKMLTDVSDNYFSIVSIAGSFKSIEDQTASIADAISRLLQSFEEFKKSNP